MSLKGETGMEAVLNAGWALIMMGLALGMDAFSISVGMGMYSIRAKRMLWIGLVVGLFHVIMPLVGILVGEHLSTAFGDIAKFVGGAILLILGFRMVYVGIFKQDEPLMSPTGIGLFFFAFSVSLDSFSAALSLGILGLNRIAVISVFGVCATLLTWAGFIIGRKFQGVLGGVSEVMGGGILFAVGLHMIMPI
jgi:putative Mn2+ efflux pump MntP